MITRDASYSSRAQPTRIRAKQPAGLAAPRGFSRPTASSNARRSPPRRAQEAMPSEISTEVGAPLLPTRQTHSSGDDTWPPLPVAHPNTTTTASHSDARLDKDIVLAPYWSALREKGFESAAVLQTLSRDQAMRALELCGVDKIGHRWYILNKYCTPAPQTTTPIVATNPELSSGDASHRASRYLFSNYTPEEQPPVPVANRVGLASGRSGPTVETRGQPTQLAADLTPSSPVASSHDSVLEGASPAATAADVSAQRSVLYRRLLRPKVVASRRRSPSSPSRRRTSTSPIGGGISKDLLHPPEHHDIHEPGASPPRPSPEVLGVPTATLQASLFTPGTIAPLQHTPPLHWGTIASPPIASLHESSTYKTLVSLLGTPPTMMGTTSSGGDAHHHRRAAATVTTVASQRRRSTSPPSDTHSTSSWVLEAARRRFLAPSHDAHAVPPRAASAVEMPLSPFVFSRPL